MEDRLWTGRSCRNSMGGGKMEERERMSGSGRAVDGRWAGGGRAVDGRELQK